MIDREHLEKMTVRGIMTRSVETADPDTDVGTAAQIMFKHKYGCLPVVKDDRLVGILTEADFVRHLA